MVLKIITLIVLSLLLLYLVGSLIIGLIIHGIPKRLSVNVNTLHLQNGKVLHSDYLQEGIYVKSNNIFFSWINIHTKGSNTIIRFSNESRLLNNKFKSLKYKI